MIRIHEAIISVLVGIFLGTLVAQALGVTMQVHW